MGKANKRKPTKPPYDMGNPRDAMDYKVLTAAGWPTDKRYPRSFIDALEVLPIEQIKRVGPSLMTTRRMLEGSEERTVESVAAQVTDIPDTFLFLGARLCEAVSDYQAVWNAARPAETVSLQPRMSGGSISSDPYDQEKLEAWQRVRRQMSSKQARLIEQFLIQPSRDRVSTSNMIEMRFGASKLAEYFSANSAC